MANAPSQEKQKKEFALVACLLLALTLLIVYNVRRAATIKARQRQQPSVSTAPSNEAPPPVAETAPATKEVSLTSLRDRAKGLKWVRDPFVLNLGRGEELPVLQLKVSGIIYDPDHPEATYAIINEDVVRIGDDLHGIKVVDIQADAVRLKKFNQEFTLYLYQETK